MILQVGQSSDFTKTISESDVYGFAGIVGDYNEAHVNIVKAEEGVFGGRIAHGMLVGSLISTVLGTKLPGSGTIYLEQNLRFRKPVYFGDTCTAVATVAEIINQGKGIYKMNTIVNNQYGDIVIDGYAVIKYKGDEKNE